MFDGDDVAVVFGEGFDPFTGPGYDGRSDEDSGDGFFDAFDFDFVFKTVDLGAEGVSADGDVEEVEGVLVAAFDFFGHEDHAHAGAPDGEAFFCLFLDGRAEAVAFHEEADGGGFSAGEDEAVDFVQVFGGADFFGGESFLIQALDGFDVLGEISLDGDDSDDLRHWGSLTFGL